jgi:hypothetical protein
MRSFSYLKKLWIVLIVFGWITVPSSLGFDLGLVLGLALGFLVGFFAGLRLGMIGLPGKTADGTRSVPATGDRCSAIAD